jgi:hypothetical protein
MENIASRLAAAGAVVPEILLPDESISLDSWAVIACDQYTQDENYWKAVAEKAASKPSCLEIIYPEVFLDKPDRRQRIQNIQESMYNYLNKGIFRPPRKGCIYIERSTPFHPMRRGLLLAFDLEEYDWRPESRGLIRCTEGTVSSRLPPRMEIRRGAALEIPHILILIDDEEDAILPALGDRARLEAPLYSGSLMLDSGEIQGWPLDKDLAVLADGLEGLAERAAARYGRPAAEKPFLFAVGDGNHSLAAAKAVWEEYKGAHAGEPGLMNHPARYALAELENLYDPGIAFEPIHRALFGLSADLLLEALSALPGFSVTKLDGSAALAGLSSAARTRYAVIGKGLSALVETSAPGIATGPLQPLLDGLLARQPGASIDYIHGGEACLRLAEQGAIAILLPPVKKEDLFTTVARSGPLPRKSFSMGASCEKRFYLECRKLFA